MIAGAAACSSIKVVYDYDQQTDFTKYKTYGLIEDDLLASANRLDRDRIITGIENELAAKGFAKSDNPDVLVDVHIKSEQKMEATATTTGGFGRWGGYGGYSTTQINYDEYTVGTMFITFIDNAEQLLIWQGTGSKTLYEGSNLNKKEAHITFSIQQILSNYPPSK